MDKILAYLAEFKSSFTGISASLAKVTAAEDRVKALEIELANEKTDSTSKIKGLTDELQKAQDKANTLGTEVKALEVKVTAAEDKAHRVLASQGIDPALVPASEESAGTGTKGETAWAKYNRLRNEDPRAAGAFYAANADAIFASRSK